MRQTVIRKLLNILGAVFKILALKCAKANMAMREPRHHRAAGGGWLIAARQLLACLYQRESFGRIDAKALQIGRG